jgi:hypothetical protein
MQLQEHGLDNNFNHDEFMSGVFAQLERCVAEVRGELGYRWPMAMRPAVDA